MIPLIKHTFTHPITHSETVALAMRHWPMPCVIEIKDPTFDKIILTEFLRYGMDFGPGGETVEEALKSLLTARLKFSVRFAIQYYLAHSPLK